MSIRKRIKKIKEQIKSTIRTFRSIYKVTKLFVGLISDFHKQSKDLQNKEAKRFQHTDKEIKKMKKEILADLVELQEKFKEKDMTVTFETLIRKDQLKIRNPQTNRDMTKRNDLYREALKILKKENLLIEKESGELKITERGKRYLKEDS